jgi:ankyrin repeat protein
MILLKDLWINHILTQLSPIDLSRFQQVSKWCLTLSKHFQHIIDRWKKFVNIESSDRCLYEASTQGHKDLVHFFINKGANDWNFALHCASQGGHKDLIQFFIDKGATDWNSALSGASQGGHKDLVRTKIRTPR